MDDLNIKLDQSRQELLDLTLRNTLINYRPLKARGVTIVDELPQELHQLLVFANKKMTFLPKPETIKQDSDFAGEEIYEEENEVILPPILDLAEDEILEHHRDTKLQTSHIEKDLQKRLLNTYYAARTYVQEQGVNILYLALGMLEWYEAPQSEIKRQAPLILIPVTLTRSSVKAPFRLQYTGDDLGENLSLHAKLHTDFGLDFPSIPESDNLSLSDYFNSVEQAINTKSRWNINREAVALGFFTFGAFLMYNDLDASQWSEQNDPGKHSIMKALLGNGFQNSITGDVLLQLDEDTFIDDYVRPQESHQVVDADSSQILAILDVNHGHNLVIQGPPGTGKSQTITNIIAEAIGAGKKVLFVAEKMAALEVVKRRLDTVGLGDACLELHSHKTNKKSVLAELQRTQSLSRPFVIDGSHDYQALLEKQNQLNAYSRAVNIPILQSGITPYSVYGQLIQIRRKLINTDAPELKMKNSDSWSQGDFQQRTGIVEELQNLIQDTGSLIKHPFWGSQYTTFLPNNRRLVEEAAQKAEESVAILKNKAGKINDYLNIVSPNSLEDCERSNRMAQDILTAPNLVGIAIKDNVWRHAGKNIQEAVATGERINDLHTQYNEVFIPEAWTQDMLPVRKAYAAYGDKWWRIFSGEFRKAKRELAGLCQITLPKEISVQMEMVEALLEVQRLTPVLLEQEPLFSRLFGKHWQGITSDWSYLTAVTDWLVTTSENIENGRSPESIIDYTAAQTDKENLQVVSISIDQARQAYEQHTTDALAIAKINEDARWGRSSGLQKLSLTQQEALFKQWRLEAGRIQEIVTYNHIIKQLNNLNMSPIIKIALTWADAATHLSDLLTRSWYDSLIEVAFKERPILSTFNSAIHEQKIARFCELDEYQFQLNKHRLARTHWDSLPKYNAGGQLGILLREFEKRSRHKPLRKLMTEAGNAIQALKPVFMMGPMSVAIYLPPDALHFDLVVFDEASQVRPVDAFGSILRGKQAVVVGDSKQLPPTSFFNKIFESDEEDNVTSDLESILGLFSAQGAPQRMLRWHYRSRHESLIAVSNHEFYDNKLVIFPSPSVNDTHRGLVYHHLPDAVYDRGKSGTNRKEAEAIAKAVMHHAKIRPELSLGVASFSIKQMQAIQDQLERHRRLDPTCEDFFKHHREGQEPFFVKNLENVQGDERDVIFISIGYGRDANRQLKMIFGPLNREGGERRLNVLITRARQRCEIFTNLEADDIDLHKTNARGVAALKQYLAYAKDGRLTIPKPTNREADSPFEEEVADSIRKLGYEVVHQVGTAGFFIDLAIKDPVLKGRYLLGVECDGATYHSARSARDRDRLRQQVLEGLGWTIHRIWSTDWFQNPTRQIERLVEAIEAAKVSKSVKPPKKSTAIKRENDTTNKEKVQIHFETPPHGQIKIEKLTQKLSVPFYKQAELNIHLNTDLFELYRERLAQYITQVVLTESPVHQVEVKRRILDAAGVTRLGSRIDTSMNAAIIIAVRQGNIKQKGDFLWSKNMDKVPCIRNRQKLPKTSQKLQFIAPEEIEFAITTAVANAYGLREDELPRATLELFGFNRVTANRKKGIQKIQAQMVARGKLYYQSEFLMCR